MSSTRTSVKNTSLKEAPPVIWRSGRTSTPGACMSTRNMVRPLCLGLSVAVRVMISPTSLNCAPDVQTFCPFTSHSSPSRTAAVWIPARSEPATGSENSWQPMISPRYSGRRYRSFTSGTACARIVGATMPSPIPNAVWGGIA